MTLYALVSAGGAPGVTTSAVALALGWPTQVVIAECDPSGGDILAGLFVGHLPASSGLLPLAVAAGRSSDEAARVLWDQLIDLDDERSRLLLAGLSDPRQAAALAPSWPTLAAAFASVPGDVLADCGRLDAAPAVEPVLTAASLAVLVLRPTLRQVSKARQRIDILADVLGGRDRLVLLLIGEGAHSAREVAKVLGVPVAAALPEDRKTAGLLSDGTGSRRGLATRPLVRAATAAGRALRGAALANGQPEPAEDAEDAGALLRESVALAAAPVWDEGIPGPLTRERATGDFRQRGSSAPGPAFGAPAPAERATGAAAPGGTAPGPEAAS
jgi:hypothetical protein